MLAVTRLTLNLEFLIPALCTLTNIRSSYMVVPTPLSTSRRCIQSEHLNLIHTSYIDLMSTYPRMGMRFP
jgi:hypothetical protein